MSKRKVPAFAPGLLVAFCACSAFADSVVPRAAGFGIRTADDGTSSLVAIDDAGGVRASMASTDAELRFGARHVAMLLRAATAGERRVEMLSKELESVSRFTVPADRDIVVGVRTVALVPRALHQPGVEFRIEFRALEGAGAGAPGVVVVRPGRTLATLVAQPDGSFLATSFDAEGAAFVDAFTADGAPWWSRSRGTQPGLPLAAIAPNGLRAIVAFGDADGSALRCELIDGSGRTVHEFATAALGTIAFDDAAAHAALVGAAGIVVIDANTGAKLFEGMPSEPPLAGDSATFTIDGARLLVAERGEGHLVLESFPISPGGESARAIELASIPLGDSERALALRDRGADGFRVVTSAGAWNLAK